MGEIEFKERVLAELTDLKGDVREVRSDVKELMGLRERMAVIETKALLFGGGAGIIAAAVIAKVLR